MICKAPPKPFRDPGIKQKDPGMAQNAKDTFQSLWGAGGSTATPGNILQTVP